MKLVILLLCMVQYVSSGRIYAQVTPNKYCGGANWQTNFDNPSSNHGIVPDQFQSPNVDTTIPYCISDCENTAGCNAALYRFTNGYHNSEVELAWESTGTFIPANGAIDCIVCTSSPITWYTNGESGYLAKEYYGYMAFPASNSGKRWHGQIWEEDAPLEVPVNYTILPCDDSGQMYQRGPGLCKDGFICFDNGDVLECPSGAQRLNDTHCSSRKADVSNALHTAGLLSAPTSDTDAQANTCCSAGRYVLRGPNSVSCELCPAGTFNPGSSNALACTACPAGTYQDSTGTTSCIPWTGCDKGYFSVGGSAVADGTCSPCPPNTFQPNDNSRATQCTPWTTCSAGYYARIAATDVNDNTCSICGPNTYQPNVSFATACDQCPHGTIAPLGASSCSSWAGKKFRPNTYQQVVYGSGPARMCRRSSGGWYTTMADYAENIWPVLGVRVTEDSCKTACNLNPQCTAFVHGGNNNPVWADCYLCLGPYNGNGRDGYYFSTTGSSTAKVYQITNRRSTTDWEDFSIATPSELQNFYNSQPCGETIVEVTSGVPHFSLNETECQAYAELDTGLKWKGQYSHGSVPKGCFKVSVEVYWNTHATGGNCGWGNHNCLEYATTYQKKLGTCTEGDYCFPDGTVLECPSGTVRLNATHCSSDKEVVYDALKSHCPL